MPRAQASLQFAIGTMVGEDIHRASSMVVSVEGLLIGILWSLFCVRVGHLGNELNGSTVRKRDKADNDTYSEDPDPLYPDLLHRAHVHATIAPAAMSCRLCDKCVHQS